ncbi:hypothetical protein BSKO_08741 [Bryopsis sp. KO-2023]|nr:hypothetical protein BSKO_08741 [Bryopsis sp. KO-2023]
MAAPADEGQNATHDIAATCLGVIRNLEGEVSQAGRPTLCKLESYLERVVGSKEGEQNALDADEKAYLLNYTDSITLKKLPVKRGSFLASDEPSPAGLSRSRGNSMSSEAFDIFPDELSKIDSWEEFDIFSLDRSSDSKPLQMVVLVLLDELKLLDSLNLDRGKMKRFLQMVERTYRTNPYHNHVHAADVVQALGVFLCKDDLKSKFTDLELLAMVMAAAVHDVGHPGVTNEFHVNTHSELAIMYNDRAVNENMHASTAFKLMSDESRNVLGDLDREDFKFVRRSMINIILATDMASHKSLLSRFSVHAEKSDGVMDNWASDEARSALRQMLVHSADISNPARPWHLATRWSHNVMEELFAQGDRERALDLPYSPLCNRDLVQIPKSQNTFLEYVVKPSFELLASVAPKSAALALSHVAKNIKRWDDLRAEPNSGPGTPPGNNCHSGTNGT